MTTCSKCGLPRKTGSRCKPCNAAYARQRRIENPERNREIQKSYRARNIEKIRTYRKSHEALNKEYYNEKKRNWKDRNPEKQNEYRVRYRSNREKVSAQQAEWRKNNPEKIRAKNNNRRAQKASAIGRLTATDWDQIVASQGGRCKYCGRKGKLTIDHKVPLAKGGSNMPHNIQGLCVPCNSGKRDKLSEDTQFSLFDRPLAFIANLE